MEILLTAKDLKTARESLNLSQAKVAKGANINRSYLSQFESEQRLLKDEEKQAIYDYYLSLGLEDNSIEDEPVEVLLNEGKIQLIDGFEVPLDCDPVQVEDWLVELNDNEMKLEGLLKTKDRSNFLFSDSDYEKAVERTLLLMADNYVIIKYLQGYRDLLNCSGDSGKTKTCGSFLEKRLEDLSEESKVAA